MPDLDPPVPTHLHARFEAVLADLPELAGTPRTVASLQGGLTNVNVKVSTPGRTAVVRLSGPDGDLLSIDRDAENVNSRRAAASGAAPAVLAYLPQHQALVVEWVEGRTLVADDMRDEETLVRAAQACRRLHAGSRFVGDFDMFEVQRRYLRIVQERGYELPPRYLDLLPQVDRIAAALDVRRQPSVPCNNDLLAANFIDDGVRLWIIDYEYGGNGDPCFELGNLWAESDLPAEHLDLLVDTYLGTHLHHYVARARLLALMARYGWTLWAVIQDVVSPIDFDFRSWGLAKYDRALAEFDGPDLDRVLDEATRSD